MDRRLRSNPFALLTLCLLVALALTDCGRGDDRIQTDGSTATILLKGDEWVLGPDNDDNPQHLVFLTLVTYDTSGPHGRLAERWEHSTDYREWTFHLRRDVRWHDGVPFTVHDIVFTLELFAHPAVLPANRGLWRNMESFVVHDDFTFTITYAKPTDALDGWAVYYPRHLLEDLDPAGFWEWEFWTHPVGNGPYRYVRHVPKEIIELEANLDYYRGKPRIERVVLKFAGSSPLTELLSGSADAVVYFNPINIPKLAADPRFRIYHGTVLGLRWGSYWLGAIYWNQRSILFRDPAVRRAVTLAIDRRELHQVVNLPDDLPIFDGIFTGPQFWERRLGTALPYDPERAKQLLDAAGWRDEDRNGIRERGGEEFRFAAIVPPGQLENTLAAQAAIYVQAQLRRVGIRMDLETLDIGLVRERVRAGEFDAAFSRFPNDPAELLRRRLFGDGSPIGYGNRRIVELLEAAEITIDPEAKDQVYRELMEIFREELPFTFLFPHAETFVAHRRLRGLRSPDRANPAEYLEYLWIEDEN